MCLADPPDGSFADRCELPAGHAGPHDWEEKREEQPPLVDVAENESAPVPADVALTDHALSPEEVAAVYGDVTDGMVVLREPDVDELVERAFAGMAVQDIDAAGLALLARVKRARGES